MVLLAIIVFLESFGLEFKFIDQANFFDLTAIAKKQTNLPKIDLARIASYPVLVKNPAKIEIDADSYLAVDLDSQRILAKKNAGQQRPIASLTKIMTAIIVLENMDLDQPITIDKGVREISGSKIYISANDKFTVRQLLKGMLIRSANDCAYALQAGYDQKIGQGKFAEKMNQKAKKLGLTRTKYIEATGLDEQNISTAKDVSHLTEYALKNSFFKEIVKTYTATIRNIYGYGYPITSTNRLLRTDPDIFGIKTGYLEEAGECLVAGAEENGHRIITVVLGAHDNNSRFWETRELINGSFSNYRW